MNAIASEARADWKRRQGGPQLAHRWDVEGGVEVRGPVKLRVGLTLSPVARPRIGLVLNAALRVKGLCHAVASDNGATEVIERKLIGLVAFVIAGLPWSGNSRWHPSSRRPRERMLPAQPVARSCSEPLPPCPLGLCVESPLFRLGLSGGGSSGAGESVDAVERLVVEGGEGSGKGVAVVGVCQPHVLERGNAGPGSASLRCQAGGRRRTSRHCHRALANLQDPLRQIPPRP